MMSLGRSSGYRVPREPTRKQQIVELCIEAIGPLYAGKESSGATTTLYAYCARKPVPAARVTRRRPRAGAAGVGLHVLRDDLVDIFLLADRLAELEEELERER